MKTYPLSEELRLYLSSTDACLIKLKQAIESDNALELDRLKAIIEYQSGACDRMKIVVDKLLGVD